MSSHVSCTQILFFFNNLSSQDSPVRVYLEIMSPEEMATFPFQHRQTKFVNEPLEHKLPHNSPKSCLPNTTSASPAEKLQLDFEKRRAIITFFIYMT